MGELVVQSATDENRKAVITFKECGWFSKNFRVVDAVVYNSDGNAVFELSGKWNDTINAKRLIDSKVDLEEEFNFRLDEDQVIWENTIKTVSNKYKKWKFSRATVKTVKVNDKLCCTLPKSDSRFRPDRIALEEGNVKSAGKEKNKLEEIQREKRKFREKKNLDYVPNYFEKTNTNGIDYWTYNFKYEAERDERIKLYNEGQIQPTVDFMVDNILEDEDKIEIVNHEEIEDIGDNNSPDDEPLPDAEEYFE